jgi:hypothetical protein
MSWRGKLLVLIAHHRRDANATAVTQMLGVDAAWMPIDAFKPLYLN